MLIEVKDLVKIYNLGKTEVHALKGVTLNIDYGELVAIIGPSGSGKSTLMHIIGCLDKPTEGEVLFEGIKVSNMRKDDLAKIRNKKIGFVFQTFNLLPRQSALFNVSLPLIYSGVDKKERINRAIQALEQVGLKDRMNHRPIELSGGEQQRVAIARALVNNPVIILADEPTGNLDTKTGEHIIQLLEKLNEAGKTVLIVTHNKEIAYRCNRILQLIDGKLIE